MLGRILLAALALGLLMALALPTEPLFYGNQNTKFARGLAQAGYGALGHDWFVNTTDPMPVFTAFVAMIASYADISWFYVIQFLGYAGFAAAVLAWHRLVAAELRIETPIFAPFVLLLAFFFSSAAGLKIWQGVAVQYLVHDTFEPPNFGILLLVGVACFVVKRYLIGVVLALIAAAFHPAYAVPAGMILVAAALTLVPPEQRRTVWPVLAIGCAVLATQLILLKLAIAPPGGEGAVAAARTIADDRIPDHSLVSRWFDFDAQVKTAWIVIAIIVLRRRPLGRFLAIVLALVAIATLVSLWPAMAQLRLVAPWRVLVVIVPIANVVVLTAFLAWLVPRLKRTRPAIANGLAGALVLGTLVFLTVGLVQKVPRYAFAEPPGHIGWARVAATPDNVFMTPVDWQHFRLQTGAAQYVTHKSHPYRPDEVVEWERRIAVARAVERRPEASCDLLLSEALGAGVTHAIWPAQQVADAPCPFLHEVFRSDEAVVFAIDAGA